MLPELFQHRNRPRRELLLFHHLIYLFWREKSYLVHFFPVNPERPVMAAYVELDALAVVFAFSLVVLYNYEHGLEFCFYPELLFQFPCRRFVIVISAGHVSARRRRHIPNRDPSFCFALQEKFALPVQYH